jgi:protoheme IX farnesyltransferase
MPVVAGEVSTRRQILLYTVLLMPLTLLPCLIPPEQGGTGAVYGISAVLLGLAFLSFALRVGLRRKQGDDDTMKPEKQMFGFSILYLFVLFAALVADHWLKVQIS